MSDAEIIAIANQKGGVGKTTTTFSLGVALAKQGKKVLLIDADPQGDLTTCLGYYDQDNLQNTIGTLMANTIYDNEINAEDAILHHKEGIDLIPANLDLSAIEFSLVNAMSREFTLKNSISNIRDKYDYILIDCMPSLGMITINALACSDKIVIPVQGEYLAAKGMGHLLKTVTRVQKQINPNLKIGGVVLTLVDKRTNLSKNVRNEIENNYGQYVKIYNSEIPKAINTAKSTSTGKSIFEFDKNSPVANAYENLAKEVLSNERTRIKNDIAKCR
ncbi:MAG: ParA family protein [Clostridia bacterium]|nr:ParA family protein [Clostridia bacterium]